MLVDKENRHFLQKVMMKGKMALAETGLSLKSQRDCLINEAL